MTWRISQPIRLIDFLKEHAASLYSARFIKRALEANVCRVNGKVERFGSARLEKGDLVELAPNWNAAPTGKRLAILFENDDFLVIDKPAGIVCTDRNFEKILEKKVFLAHRLDKDTTGVLLFGKSLKIAEELQNRFRERDVKKEYLSIVDGALLKERGVIESHLAKKGSFQGQTLWGSARSGLFAKTAWERLQAGSDASMVICRPETGRTHQIRVHLAEMGHPILVDRQYAARFRSSLSAARPLLHAWRLAFDSFVFVSPLPEDFLAAQKILRMDGPWPLNS